MATNPGVIILTKEQLRGTFMHHRLDIEDNIGEEMHIHYKNFRFDFTFRDFMELAKSMDESLHNLSDFKKRGNTELEIYLRGTGKVTTIGTEVIPIKSKNDISRMDNTDIKDYTIWNDTDRGLNLFIILKHTPWVDDKIVNNKNVIDKIIDYTQQDNKIIEVYGIDSERIVTKYYDGWFPFLIKSSNNWWDDSIFKQRQYAYYDKFTNEKRAKEFYESVIQEYVQFHLNTGCYFSDVFPNNILVNRDYSDFRLIDIGCLRYGSEVKKPSFSQVITGDAANNQNFIDVQKLNLKLETINEKIK